MITQTCTPAALADFMVTTKLTVPTRLYAHLLVQVTAGEAWAVYAEHDLSSPIAVAGLFAWPDRESEAWFKVDRTRAGRALTECLIALRRVLREAAPHHSMGIISRVEPGNRAGETIARFLGFAPEGGEQWRWEWPTSSKDCSDRAIRKSC